MKEKQRVGYPSDENRCEVGTPLGDVIIRYDPMNRKVQVIFDSDFNVMVSECVSNDDRPTIEVCRITNPPSIGDEITQNGRTAEVGDVKFAQDKFFVLLDGVWEEWQE